MTAVLLTACMTAAAPLPFPKPLPPFPLGRMTIAFRPTLHTDPECVWQAEFRPDGTGRIRELDSVRIRGHRLGVQPWRSLTWRLDRPGVVRVWESPPPPSEVVAFCPDRDGWTVEPACEVYRCLNGEVYDMRSVGLECRVVRKAGRLP